MLTIDTRGLEPPEPFEKILEALRTLAEGDSVTVVLDREPVPLYRFLKQNDYRYETTISEPSCVQIRIWEP